MGEFADTIHPDLGAHAEAFLRAAPDIAALAGLTITAGSYIEAGDMTATEGPVTIQPRFKLKIAAENATVEGERVSFDGLSVAAGATDVALVVLEERADAAVDDEATLTALLTPYGSEGAAWATAIANDPNRSANFARALADIELPPNPPSDDAVVLQAYLSRHFTYSGEAPTYYPKWAGDGRSFPTDVHAGYRTNATHEQILTRDRFYCLCVQSEAGSGPVAAVETLTEITLVPEQDLPRLDLVYRARRQEPSPTNECCFFYADAGTGITVPPAARGSLRPALANLGLDRPAAEIVADLNTADSNTPAVTDDGLLVVTAVVKPGSFEGTPPALPDGVRYLGGELDDDPGADGADGADDSDDPDDGDADDSLDEVADSQQDHIRYFACPADKLIELAALEDIVVLQPVQGVEAGVNTARGHINHAALLTNLGVAGGGQGVFIGIVDTGIDGRHPAFAGRIHRVWDQTAAANPAHPPPAGLGNNFGQVWDTAAEIVANSVDTDGHGTHVAGIAAGAPAAGYTAGGVAQNARLLIVRGDFTDSDRLRRGVAWCFREAGRSPCVVNMSLGNHGTGHDGVDNFSLGVRRTFRRRNAAGTAYTWLPGRVVVACVMNAGASRGHFDMARLAPAAIGSAVVGVATRPSPPGSPTTPTGTFLNIFARPLPAASRGCRIDVRVRRGVGAAAAATPWFAFTPNGAPQVAMLGTTVVRVVNGPPVGATHGLIFTQHQHVNVGLFNLAGIPAGQYTIDVRNASAVDIGFDAYQFNALAVNGAHPVFFTAATQRHMITGPASANGVIGVGATVNRASWRPLGAPADGSGDTANREPTFHPTTNLVTGATPAVVGALAGFSDPGPVRGSSRTVTIAAPGSGVLSARSSQAAGRAADDIDANTTQMTGTSQACPVITGVVACILENHPTWTAARIASRLRSAVVAPLPAGWDTARFGPGPLDASRIVV